MGGQGKAFLIGALIIALAALAFFYYQDQNTVSIGSSPTADIKTGTNN